MKVPLIALEEEDEGEQGLRSLPTMKTYQNNSSKPTFSWQSDVYQECSSHPELRAFSSNIYCTEYYPCCWILPASEDEQRRPSVASRHKNTVMKKGKGHCRPRPSRHARQKRKERNTPTSKQNQKASARVLLRSLLCARSLVSAPENDMKGNTPTVLGIIWYLHCHSSFIRLTCSNAVARRNSALPRITWVGGRCFRNTLSLVPVATFSRAVKLYYSNISITKKTQNRK